jgi:hypothetical protein
MFLPGVASAEIVGKYDVLGMAGDTGYAGRIEITKAAPGLTGTFTDKAGNRLPYQRLVGFAEGDSAMFAITSEDGAVGAMIVREKAGSRGNILEATYAVEGGAGTVTETWMRAGR